MTDFDFLIGVLGLAACVVSIIAGILLAYTAAGLIIGVVSREPTKR